MEIHNRVSLGVAISSLGVALALWSEPVAARPLDFCSSVPGACEYAGPDAPVMAATVCWNGTLATLPGSNGCSGGTRPFWVEHGAIDPLTGAIEAYVALDDACGLGWCSVLSPGGQMPTLGGEVCCQPEPITGTCTLNVLDCEGEVLWCDGYQPNNDGTIECVQPDE